MAEKLQPGKFSGELSAAGFRFGVVVSRFNSFITERLLAAAVDALERAGAGRKDSKRGSPPSKWLNFHENFAPRIREWRLPESRGASNVSLRTKSREFAMQMLFQWDMSQQDFTKLEVKFWKSAKAADKTRAFANKLFEGAAKDITALDAIIVKHADNWRFERLAAIDRAILRLAIHELTNTDTARKVIIHG